VLQNLPKPRIAEWPDPRPPVRAAIPIKTENTCVCDERAAKN